MNDTLLIEVCSDVSVAKSNTGTGITADVIIIDNNTGTSVTADVIIR